ncbi:zinc finger BED domain-containing protein RICESLEEPER 2 [Tanacetum coccineum]
MDDDMSSLPTNHESFSSQQNYTMEDDTIDLHGVDLDSEPNHVKDIKKNDKKRQRKAPSKPRKTFSECWNYFDPKFEPDENGVMTKMAYCKWCPAVYKADSVKMVQKKIGGDVEGGSTSGTLQTWKYDEKVIKKSLIELIVLAELPFKFVEHPAFHKFCTNMQPKFNLPSRFTIARDVSKFYLEERKDLVNFLSNSSTTVHLTTDTWTSSCKRMNFMVLTAHFIDDNWNVMTMTVDNIASNDKALEYLLENLPSKYDDGKHFHGSSTHSPSTITPLIAYGRFSFYDPSVYKIKEVEQADMDIQEKDQKESQNQAWNGKDKVKSQPSEENIT